MSVHWPTLISTFVIHLLEISMSILATSEHLTVHLARVPDILSYVYSELIVKYNIGLKTLLQQGISEPTFYGDLVYKFKRIVGKPNFSDQFKKIVKRYIRVGYNLDIM